MAAAIATPRGRTPERVAWMNMIQRCSLTLTELADTSQASRQTFRRRLAAGEGAESATRPANPRLYVFAGEHLPSDEIARRTGIPHSNLHRRLQRHGGDVDLAIAAYHQNGRGKRQ